MKSSTLDKKGVLVSLAGATVFAGAVLLPFLIHSGSFYFSTGQGLPFKECADTNSIFMDHGVGCLSWGSAGSISLAFAVGLIAVAVVGIFGIRYAKRGSINKIKSFTNIHLLIALLAAGATILAYCLLISHSQQNTYKAEFLPAGGWNTLSPPALGFGLRPAAVAVLSAVYLIGALLPWYLVRFSRLYVAGLKKKELFQ